MTQPAMLQVAARDGVLVLALDGEIDIENAAGIGERLSASVSGADPVVIDLRAVRFMDSQAIALLDRLAGRLEREGRPLAIVAPPASVPRRVLEIVGLGIDLHDDPAGAIEAVSEVGRPEPVVSPTVGDATRA